jgi:hypothetical protein
VPNLIIRDGEVRSRYQIVIVIVIVVLTITYLE